MNRKPPRFSRRLALCLLLSPLAARVWGQARDTARRIGTYDSRAVAMAYAGSRFRRQKMDELKARLQQAQQVGDAQAVARVEAEGRAWQQTLHRQGFGVAPVEDLLLHIQADLPRIQQAAGVTRLVSRWNLVELARHPLAERVDLTMGLVEAFQPDARQRQRAVEIQQQAPAATP